ncbi:MAG: hypothetical protein U1E73_03270 [Planctomycetota bacterium]
MIGTNSPTPQRFPAVAAGLLLLTACGGGGGSAAPNVAPTVVAAAFVGGSSTPQTGDTLLLSFSEDVQLSGTALTDADLTLSGSATLGNVTALPTLSGTRSVAITLGAGVSFTPDVTTVTLSSNNDAVRDAAGALGATSSPVTIGHGDGSVPTLTAVTIAGVDAELNGTGPAGGTLQVPPNGWTLDLTFADNSAIAGFVVQASVPVATSSGSQPAGTDLAGFLTVASNTSTAASLSVPATVSFPAGPVTLTCVVIDASGLTSTPATFQATVHAFTDGLRPFETTANAHQVWFLDFTRDIESFSPRAITNGVAVDVNAGANGRSDFEDLLRILGLNHTSPLPNVDGNGNDSNAVAQSRLKTHVLDDLAQLYAGANVSFTLTAPSGSFGSNSSVPYSALDHSRIAIAGSPTSPGILGVAIFDPSNTTQDDDTLTDYQGIRLGIFLHTIVNAGMGPPSSSAFRQTYGTFAGALGGTPIGADGADGQRLVDTLNDARATEIDNALADFGRFIAVVLAHECGHSVGLVENGAMPVGLYGNDTTNFPGSTDGHIRTPSLFPAGATNVMNPSLSYSSAINASSAFNSLNLAYLREQVFYGN